MIRDLQIDFMCLMYESGYPQEIVKKANKTTTYINDLFLRLLLDTKVKMGGKVTKFNISLTLDENQIKFCTSDTIGDVHTVFLDLMYDNLDDYFELSLKEQADFTVNQIVKGFDVLSSKEKSIDMNVVNAVAQKCRELNFKNHYYFFPLKSSKNRKHKAGIWVEHNAENFRIFLDIIDKEQQVIRREFIAETDPYYIRFYPLLGGVKWIDNDNVEIFNRKREVLKKIKIPQTIVSDTKKL